MLRINKWGASHDAYLKHSFEKKEFKIVVGSGLFREASINRERFLQKLAKKNFDRTYEYFLASDDYETDAEANGKINCGASLILLPINIDGLLGKDELKRIAEINLKDFNSAVIHPKVILIACADNVISNDRKNTYIEEVFKPFADSMGAIATQCRNSSDFNLINALIHEMTEFSPKPNFKVFVDNIDDGARFNGSLNKMEYLNCLETGILDKKAVSFWRGSMGVEYKTSFYGRHEVSFLSSCYRHDAINLSFSRDADIVISLININKFQFELEKMYEELVKYHTDKTRLPKIMLIAFSDEKMEGSPEYKKNYMQETLLPYAESKGMELFEAEDIDGVNTFIRNEIMQKLKEDAKSQNHALLSRVSGSIVCTLPLPGPIWNYFSSPSVSFVSASSKELPSIASLPAGGAGASLPIP